MHPGMVLVFVAERSSLKESDTEIFEEFIPRNLGSEQEYGSTLLCSSSRHCNGTYQPLHESVDDSVITLDESPLR